MIYFSKLNYHGIIQSGQTFSLDETFIVKCHIVEEYAFLDTRYTLGRLSKLL